MFETKVKMCGITNHEDAQKALFYGAWAVGFVFYKKSPRYVSPSKAKKLIEGLPPFITPVGLFVNQSERAVEDICRFANISVLQFHGDETPVYCKRFKKYKVIKAFRIRDDFDFRSLSKYKVDAYLFDAYQENAFGGTGKTFQWNLLKGQKFEKPVILSGGLTPENVAQAIAETSPYAVDVSSGIEQSPGIKSPKLIRAFMESIRASAAQ
ncbi:MAG: phosphoribosylanthranilate isomerase [Candidatus Omnitrophica bacterium]|nr:phosphoribosylanthranilate isomerase [Candidatus Omnitrophota bacterium]MCB9746914.1 phosphoribosylanthranilate isomerase [Candidatus Omnitrophota bacterium]